jgi:FkbM family methyltransferase
MKEDDGYERQTLRMWSSVVKPGQVVLDVGAYTGLFSIIAGLNGASVVAFEPMPANRWRLGINLALNKVAATIYDCAVSDTNGKATLNFNPGVPLTTGASLEPGIPHHRTSLLVRTVRIDGLALQNIAAIKIDVERHEPAVLRGAMQTIKRDRPVMMIETLDDAMREAILEMLPDYNITAVLDYRNTFFTPK